MAAAVNPAGEAALALDGRMIEGVRVAGRRLPVSYDRLAESLSGLMDELEPAIVISLGLWPGESVIRLERIGINAADFEIPDNEGLFDRCPLIRHNGDAALMATLPNREIRDALLAAGIPARISATAGTFLCNATLYSTLTHAAEMRRRPVTGFIHVPYLPDQQDKQRHQRVEHRRDRSACRSTRCRWDGVIRSLHGAVRIVSLMERMKRKGRAPVTPGRSAAARCRGRRAAAAPAS